MKVFVTGATGFVGSAVVNELIAGGHQVVGLARSDASATALAAVGATVLRGTLEDSACLRRGAASADAVVHTGFNHDFSRFAENCAVDRAAIAALGAELLGSQRPLMVTSGVAFLAQGRPGTEADMGHPPSVAFPRASEAAAGELAARGVRAAVMRLAPSVHGTGDHGFVPMLIGIARQKKMSVFTGGAANRWPAVHRLDAARAFRLALERNLPQPRYHAVAEEAVPFRAIAEVIGRRLGVPVVEQPAAAAAEHFGWFARFAQMDAPATSADTRRALGWEPREPGLLADIDRPEYFTAATS